MSLCQEFSEFEANLAFDQRPWGNEGAYCLEQAGIIMSCVCGTSDLTSGIQEAGFLLCLTVSNKVTQFDEGMAETSREASTNLHPVNFSTCQPIGSHQMTALRGHLPSPHYSPASGAAMKGSKTSELGELRKSWTLCDNAEVI